MFTQITSSPSDEITCPFCEGQDFDTDERQDDRGRFWAWTVHCDNCGAEGPPGETREEALERFTNRGQHNQYRNRKQFRYPRDLNRENTK